jgi:hypothetical protein
VLEIGSGEVGALEQLGRGELRETALIAERDQGRTEEG